MQYDVLIIGAGFGGIKTAQQCVRRGLSVCLVSDRSYFEYYPAMYRLAVGAPQSSAIMPLDDIKYRDKITLVVDAVTAIDLAAKSVTCASGASYKGTRMVIALGVTNSYFNIPGMEEYSFGFKSAAKAVHLHERVMSLFEKNRESDVDEQLAAFHFVIAGGGVSGVEIAGELAQYARQLAAQNGVSPSLVSIDIVDSNASLVSNLPEAAQLAVSARLKKLGVRILCNRKVMQNHAWTVTLSDMVIASKTVIWAAGVAPHPLVVSTPNMPLSPKKRIVVDGYLAVQGFNGVYAIGDCSESPNSGLAQTADRQAVYLARELAAICRGKTAKPYRVPRVAYVVPVGKWWGVFIYKNIVIGGVIPWLLRFGIDIKFYLSILPVRRVCAIIADMMRA